MSDQENEPQPEPRAFDPYGEDDFPGASSSFPFPTGAASGLPPWLDLARQVGFIFVDAAVGAAQQKYYDFRTFKLPGMTAVAGRAARRVVRSAETAVGIAVETAHVVRIDFLPEWSGKAKRLIRAAQRRIDPTRWH